MRLNQLSDRPGARHAKKRVGRGMGSGTGKTSGKGQKGQKSRSGVALAGFEGGQMPLYRRLPKRGFNNKKFARVLETVNTGHLQAAIDAKRLDAKKPVDEAALRAAGLVNKSRDGVKLLAKGAISTKVTIHVDYASAAAIKAVEGAGGSVVLSDDEKGRKKTKKDDDSEKVSAGGEADESGAEA